MAHRVDDIIYRYILLYKIASVARFVIRSLSPRPAFAAVLPLPPTSPLMLPPPGPAHVTCRVFSLSFSLSHPLSVRKICVRFRFNGDVSRTASVDFNYRPSVRIYLRTYHLPTPPPPVRQGGDIRLLRRRSGVRTDGTEVHRRPQEFL